MRQTHEVIWRKQVEPGRLPQFSSPALGRNGAFVFTCPGSGEILKVTCSDGAGWDHVSVSLSDRCPTWEEMAFIKAACDRLIPSDENGPGAIELHPHALAPVAELPVLEVVSTTHVIADLTLGLGKVIHDYLR